MFFKLPKESPLFMKILKEMNKGKVYNAQSFNLAKKLSDQENPEVYRKPGFLAGTIFAISFDQKPEEWKHVKSLKSKAGNYWLYPKNEEVDLLKEINSLKGIKYDDVASLFGFKRCKTRNGLEVTFPSLKIKSFPKSEAANNRVKWPAQFMLLKFNEHLTPDQINAPSDFEEIKHSEYYFLDQLNKNYDYKS